MIIPRQYLLVIRITVAPNGWGLRSLAPISKWPSQIRMEKLAGGTAKRFAPKRRALCPARNTSQSDLLRHGVTFSNLLRISPGSLGAITRTQHQARALTLEPTRSHACVDIKDLNQMRVRV